MNTFELPQGYKEIKKVDLQKNVKLAVVLNLGALVIAVVMLALAQFFVSFEINIDAQDLISFLTKSILLIISLVAYMVLHELVHGFFIKRFSGKRAHYGFTGLYAFAGSDAFFDKRSYIIIALSPIVILGLFLLILNILVPSDWFWFVYIIQVINISGAAGDLYITWVMHEMPKDVLTKDVGVSMVMYSRQG